MNTPAARIWTEQLLFRGGRLSRPRPRPSSPAAWPPASFLRASSSASPTATVRSRLPTQTYQHSAFCILRGQRAWLGRRLPPLRFKSDKSPSQAPNPTPQLGSPEPALSLTQRFKKLSREYGWLALWVYLGLTALDFPFCFLAVRTLGVERIGHYEHVIVEAAKSVLRIPFPNLLKPTESARVPIETDISEATAREGALGLSSDTEKALAIDNPAGACTTPATPAPLPLLLIYCSHMDPARARLCRSQVTHLYTYPTHGGCPPKGCQDAARLGLQRRKSKTQIISNISDCLNACTASAVLKTHHGRTVM
jgi:hypothetical protein